VVVHLSCMACEHDQSVRLWYGVRQADDVPAVGASTGCNAQF
jgi:hypothetical protein